MASEASASSVADWADLPPELVVSVGELLPVADLARLPAVCPSWAWALGQACSGRTPPPPRHSFPRVRSFPWLILPDEAGEDADRITLLRVTDGCTRCISPLPEIRGRRCVGSSPCGWLVTLDLTLEPRLLNPLTREEIPLPSLLTIHNQVVVSYAPDGSISGFLDTFHPRTNYSLEEFREHYVKRIVLTSAPPSCVAVAILTVSGRHGLAFVRPGDSAWVHPSIKPFNFEDVVYREQEGKLYSVNRWGDVLVFDLFNWRKKGKWGSLPSPMCTLFAEGHPELLGSRQTDRRYIVFLLSGDLVQIGRELDWWVEKQMSSTDIFDILKLDRKNNCWMPLKNLGDESLFIGCNGSMSLSISEVSHLQKNRIYFTEEFDGISDIRRIQPRDVGVYDLESKTFTKFFSLDCKVNWPPPIWFMPLIPRNPWES